MLFKNKLNTQYCFNAKKFFRNKSDSTCMNNVMGGGGGGERAVSLNEQHNIFIITPFNGLYQHKRIFTIPMRN